MPLISNFVLEILRKRLEIVWQIINGRNSFVAGTKGGWGRGGAALFGAQGHEMHLSTVPSNVLGRVTFFQKGESDSSLRSLPATSTFGIRQRIGTATRHSIARLLRRALWTRGSEEGNAPPNTRERHPPNTRGKAPPNMRGIEASGRNASVGRTEDQKGFLITVPLN